MTDFSQNGERKKGVFYYVFLFSFSAYLLTISGLDFRTDSGKERIELVKAVVERHGLSLTKSSELKGVDGKIYPLRGIAPALLSVPSDVLIPPENELALFVEKVI